METFNRDSVGNIIPSAPPVVNSNNPNSFQYPGTSWYGGGSSGYVFPGQTTNPIVSNNPGPEKASMDDQILRELHEVHMDINQRLEAIATGSEKRADRFMEELSNRLNQFSGRIPQMHYDMLDPQHIRIAQQISNLRRLERKNNGLFQIVMRRK